MKVLKVVMKLICLCHRIDGVWFTMQRSIVCNMTVQYTNKNNEEDIVVHQCKLKTPKSSYLDDLSSILTWERKEPKSFLQCIQNCIFVVFSINRTGKQKQARRLHGHLFPFPMFFAVATWSRPQTQLRLVQSPFHKQKHLTLLFLRDLNSGKNMSKPYYTIFFFSNWP